MPQGGVVVEKGRLIHRVPGGEDIDLGDAKLSGFEGREGQTIPLSDFNPATAQGRSKIKHALMSPELAGGIASMLAPETAGASIWGPGLVGAGMSALRDYTEGERDPKEIAGNALLHGSINAVPGAITKGINLAGGAGEGTDPLELVGSVASGKVSMLGKLMKILTSGGEQAAAENASRGAESQIANSVLPNGEKLVSPNGVKFLEQELQSRALAGKDLTDPTYNALNDLWLKAKTMLEDQGTSPFDLAKMGNISLRSPAAVAAASKAARYGSVANKTKAILAGGRAVGGVTKDYFFPQ